MSISYTQDKTFKIKIFCQQCGSPNFNLRLEERVVYMVKYEGSQQRKPAKQEHEHGEVIKGSERRITLFAPNAITQKCLMPPAVIVVMSMLKLP